EARVLKMGFFLNTMVLFNGLFLYWQEIHVFMADRNQLGNRTFWVVSPNVRNSYKTVKAWKKAMLKSKMAFMGYGPNNRTSGKMIGYKFAHVIRENDIILIARRHHKKPDILAAGVVLGDYKTQRKGLRTPGRFGSFSELSPFVQLGKVPRPLQ